MNLLREPMVHFFGLAALLFALDGWLSADSKSRIVVDQATADYLIRQREDLELRILDAEERADVIDAYVEDEILYQEAYRRGLDRGDSRMRRNLILKMRSLLTGTLEPPDEAVLRAYFDANRDRFRQPERLELEQVSFDAMAAVPPDIDRLLKTGRLEGRRRPAMTGRMMAASFGPDTGRKILAIADSQWHGPFETGEGVIYVRIVDRTPERQADFESVKDYLAGDWLMDRSRSLIRAEVERVAGDYEVVIEAAL